MIDKPKYLYKYKPLNNHTEQLFINKELYFASLNEINDPFDSRIFLERKAGKQKMWKYIISTLKKQYGDLDEYILIEKWLEKYKPNKMTIDDFRSKCKTTIKSKKYLLANLDLEAGKKTVLTQREENVRMCCFSEYPNNILMWSHYAKNHTGICLKFLNNSNTLFKYAQKVHYTRKYPKKNYFSVNDNNYYRYSVLTKAVQWKYEKEWRLIFTEEVKHNKYIFPIELLDGIIFGCNTNRDNRNMVRDWAINAGFMGKYYEAIPNKTDFKLDIRAI